MAPLKLGLLAVFLVYFPSVGQAAPVAELRISHPAMDRDENDGDPFNPKDCKDKPKKYLAAGGSDRDENDCDPFNPKDCKPKKYRIASGSNRDENDCDPFNPKDCKPKKYRIDGGDLDRNKIVKRCDPQDPTECSGIHKS